MSWVRLDDAFFRNTKALTVGIDGRAMYVAGLCYCAAELTDGKIIAAAVRVIAADAEVPTDTADKLVAVGLWQVIAEGFYVPDYLAYNPSREQVVAQRAASASRQKSRRDSQRTNGVSSPPPVPNPNGFTSHSSSTPSTAPLDDEDVETALTLFVDRKLAVADNVKEPVRWKRKVLANARVELASQARTWLDTYDVSPSEIANALLTGSVPAGWNNYRRQPA